MELTQKLEAGGPGRGLGQGVGADSLRLTSSSASLAVLP